MAKQPSRKREPLLSLCAEPGPEDGIDPRIYFRPETRRSNEHKVRRLCGHVARALSLAFPAPSDDDVLRACIVAGVDAAPDASRLLVTFGPAPGERAPDPARLLPRLERVRGRLRAEVAAALERKYVPALVFRVLASPADAAVPREEGGPTHA